MHIYRVLLADDEARIREGISRKIDWAALGLTLVGEAENGHEALELAEQLRPDIILSDIQMPFMNGLTLCERLSLSLPASKFVIFSGFDDFDYAQQAVRLKVSEYILKPIDMQKLTAVLLRIRTQLDETRAEQQNLLSLQRLRQDALPILRGLFLSRLLEGRTHSSRMMDEAVQYQVDLSPLTWQVALIQPEQMDQQRDLVLLSIQHLVDDYFIAPECSLLTFLYDDTVALLFGYPQQAEPYRLITELNRICALSQSNLNITLTIGLGLPGPLSNVSLSTQGAKDALAYRVLLGAGETLYIADIEPQSEAPLLFEEQDEALLTNAVKLGSPEDVQTVVTQLSSKAQASGSDLSQGQFFFIELVNCLLKLTRRSNLPVAEVFGPSFTGYVQITDFSSPEALSQWLLDCCLSLHQLLKYQRLESTDQTIALAKAFIAEHYQESSLSAEDLCEYLNISPAYFSTLFKRKTSMSFINFVTTTRMEAAAALLRDTDQKTYAIAKQIGYDDPNYFSYVFKRHFGMTPTKYRATAP